MGCRVLLHDVSPQVKVLLCFTCVTYEHIFDSITNSSHKLFFWFGGLVLTSA